MASVASITIRQGFYEKVILNLLSKMNLGTLLISLPDGRQLKMGNGAGVEANLEIKNAAFFKQCFYSGDIGFGESFTNGDWDTGNITNLIKWFLLNIDNAPTLSGGKTNTGLLNTLKTINKLSHLKRANSISGSKKNISQHYDLNNAFFSLFLDETMTYSSAYFREEGMTLKEAQLAKYERLCRKLKLKASDHVLEIGSGWGGNAIFMAKNYGCKVTTLTISREQFQLATERVQNEQLQDKITVLLKDYRHMEGSFDKIVSIEMLEAVGAQYYDTYFEKCSQLLNKNGLLAMQVITCPDSRFESMKKSVDWIQKHIFPGSLLPSVGAINKAINKVSDFTLVDLKDIGLHYAHTLNIWHREFNRHLSEVKSLGFDEQFIRKWNYYLCYCEAAFAMRNINVMQLLYARPNNTAW